MTGEDLSSLRPPPYRDETGERATANVMRQQRRPIRLAPVVDLAAKRHQAHNLIWRLRDRKAQLQDRGLHESHPRLVAVDRAIARAKTVIDHLERRLLADRKRRPQG